MQMPPIVTEKVIKNKPETYYNQCEHPTMPNSGMNAIYNKPNIKFEVDLPNQTLKFNNNSINFDIDQYKKTCLINGYDDIDFLVSKKEKINNFISLKC